MFTVELKVNGRVVKRYEVINISDSLGIPYGRGKQVYQFPDGGTIEHKYEDGAEILALEILKVKIGEVKSEEETVEVIE